LKKQRITIEPQVYQSDSANDEPTKDKMYIYFTLLHTYPEMNKNGATYDIGKTKETYESILNGYINFEHDEILNIGTVVESNYIDIEDGEGGKIECKAVLWKSVLQELGISIDDIKAGRYKMSMEVLYRDYYYTLGEEKVEPEGNEYLEDYKGSTYEGKVVKKVLYPHEFTGAAITANAADNRAEIFKAVASKYKNKGGQEDMFKQFETEEEFNEFLNEKADEIREEVEVEVKEELREDEEFASELREGYVKLDEVIENFDELELAEAEDIGDIVDEVKNLKENYTSLQEEVAKQRKLNERAKELDEVGFDVADLEEDKEELASMSDTQFSLLKKTIKSSMEKAKASVEDNDSDEGKGFDPNMLVNDDEDYSQADIIKNL